MISWKQHKEFTVPVVKTAGVQNGEKRLLSL
jgi:hypothetical protein